MFTGKRPLTMVSYRIDYTDFIRSEWIEFSCSWTSMDNRFATLSATQHLYKIQSKRKCSYLTLLELKNENTCPDQIPCMRENVKLFCLVLCYYQSSYWALVLYLCSRMTLLWHRLKQLFTLFRLMTWLLWCADIDQLGKHCLLCGMNWRIILELIANYRFWTGRTCSHMPETASIK